MKFRLIDERRLRYGILSFTVLIIHYSNRVYSIFYFSISITSYLHCELCNCKHGLELQCIDIYFVICMFTLYISVQAVASAIQNACVTNPLIVVAH